MNHRLASLAHGFGTPSIVRDKPLSFRLDGVRVEGFEGDTVLSAVMAAGVTGAGHFGTSALALGPRLAPDIALRADVGRTAVPMALCPARDGADLVTLGSGHGMLTRIWARLGKRLPASLAVDFAARHRNGPGVDDAGKRHADLVVVGGGVAGMAAALAGARRCDRVVLVEMRGRLGGDAALFGNREGEEPVLDIIAKLEAELRSTPNIETRLLCCAVDTAPGSVTLVSVDGTATTLKPVIERIATPHIIMATGCADRLGVFPGNRLPGMIGLGEAYHMAGTYGVWSRAPSLFAGGTNAMYRLALLAKDSGAEIVRLIDHRPTAQSRFIDFAKAMGVHQEFGTRLAGVDPGKSGTLTARTRLAWYESASEGNAEFAAGSVIMSDGWRPRLTLWARLGGALSWREDGVVAERDCLNDGMALAGSVTGLVTASGCRDSGARAVASIFGESAEPVTEDRVDDAFESPDAPPLPPLASARQAAFVGASEIFVSIPPAAGSGRRRGAGAEGPDATGALDLESLDALTRAGHAPAERFGKLVTQRLLSPVLIGARPAPQAVQAGEDTIPAYLAGRFSDAVETVMLISEDGRSFEPGMPVFADSGQNLPADAIGIVISEKEKGGLAVLTVPAIKEAMHVTVRDGARPLSATIEDR